MPKDVSNQVETLYAFVTISIFFLVLVFLIIAIVILHKKKVSFYDLEQKMQKQAYDKQLLQTQVEVQEATFNALGKELHDNLGQLISSAKWLVATGQKNPVNQGELWQTVYDTLEKAIDEMKSLSKSLDKEWLAKFDLIKNLEMEVKRISAVTSINIQFRHTTFVILSPDEQIMLFRIIQEALQNAIKHAELNKLDISIASENNLLVTCIANDGSSFDEQKIKRQSSGQGIANMRKRTALLGGTIQWNSNAESGCTVEIKIPQKPAL